MRAPGDTVMLMSNATGTISASKTNTNGHAFSVPTSARMEPAVSTSTFHKSTRLVLVVRKGSTSASRQSDAVSSPVFTSPTGSTLASHGAGGRVVAFNVT